ncbi:MAG: SpoVG family protein [Candidatus Omnitrophota bacterium]
MNSKPIVKVERMHLLNGEGPTKAFCDLMILDAFFVKGLKIVQGQKELFVGMPQQQSRDGKWYDIFFPASKEIRQGLQELVLEYYSEKQRTKEA